MPENAGQLSDAWWAARAKRFLHPVQVQIIDVFLGAGPTQSVRELGEVFTDIESSKLDYFVGRLRQLGAVDVVGRQTGVGYMDVRYQLVKEEPPKSADRTALAIQFGRNLAACRRRAQLSQKELIFRASLHAEIVSSLENGEREPSLGDVVRLASALTVSVNDLLGGIGWKPDGQGGGRFELPDVGDASTE